MAGPGLEQTTLNLNVFALKNVDVCTNISYVYMGELCIFFAQFIKYLFAADQLLEERVLFTNNIKHKTYFLVVNILHFLLEKRILLLFSHIFSIFLVPFFRNMGSHTKKVLFLMAELYGRRNFGCREKTVQKSVTLFRVLKIGKTVET